MAIFNSYVKLPEGTPVMLAYIPAPAGSVMGMKYIEALTLGLESEKASKISWLAILMS